MDAKKKKKDLSFEEADELIRAVVASFAKRHKDLIEDLYQDAWVCYLTIKPNTEVNLIKHIIKMYLINTIKRGYKK